VLYVRGQVLRFVVICCALSGCWSVARDSAQGGDDHFDSDAGAGAPAECFGNDDCALAANKCCDCPTFAVPVSDPLHASCANVMCPPMSCPNDVAAACNFGKCELTCVKMQCPMSCPAGYAIDATGCLSCTCAQAASDCVADGQCVETRADCCGCQLGGADTAVLASEQASFDASLHCPQMPFCPMQNVCEPGASPHCVQGSCALFSGPLPSNACGRDDLPACPNGLVCAVNADPTASHYGVGVCITP
jgi:hypothetical protein